MATQHLERKGNRMKRQEARSSRLGRSLRSTSVGDSSVGNSAGGDYHGKSLGKYALEFKKPCSQASMSHLEAYPRVFCEN